MERNLVSIIIVNYNGKLHLEKCLKSLIVIDYKNYEIILVDNNSSDDSIDFVKKFYPSVIIIQLEKNYGFAEPNNIGAKKASGELLLFLNNDTIVKPNFITELVKVIKTDSKIAICQSFLLKPNGEIDSSGDFVDTLGRAYSSRKKVSEVREILSARGAAMLIRKESFFDLGQFDKKFFANYEDVDIGWRAWLWGYRVVLVPSSVVYHVGGQTTKKNTNEIIFNAVKNTLILRIVNFEWHYAIKSVIILFFVTFMRKKFGIKVISDPEEGSVPLPAYGVIYRGVKWVLKNLSYVLQKRKLLNKRRMFSTKELIEKGLITRY